MHTYKLLNRQDKTAPGHILGSAQQCSRIPVPERLNATCNSILRMLVHSSMYLGANRDSEVYDNVYICVIYKDNLKIA